MKIKRYIATSMRAALDQVRIEQGADAVILSSRRTEEGIEVIAAVDYDEALFVDATRPRAAASNDAPERSEDGSVRNDASRRPGAAAVGNTADHREVVGGADAAERGVRAGADAADRRGAVAAGDAADGRGVPLPREIAGMLAPVSAVARTVRMAMRTRTKASAHASAATAAPQAAAGPRVVPEADPAATALLKAVPASGVQAMPAVRATPAEAMPAPAASANRLGVAGVATAVPAPEAHMVAMQRELKDLRSLLEGGLQQLTWNDKRLRDPVQARVLEELTAMGIAADVAMKLAQAAPKHARLENPANLPLALLAKHLAVVDRMTAVEPGIVALVGPTGAGKTTTIAKLAARWSMQHGSKDLALVSTDSYRIGAREQLATYARILGAPMLTAGGGKELAQVLERLKSKKLVLIDTAGMGPRDARLTEQLAALQLGAAGARVMLALPAQGEARALEEIARSFAPVSPSACILTKVDEASSLGPVLSISLRHGLPMAYLCNGQRVPEDLHAAYPRKVWLARMAARLKDGAPRGDGYYARNFGGAQLHA